MKQNQAFDKFRDYMRLKHLALSTEQSYLAWLVRYMRFLAGEPVEGITGEQKVEAFLSALARQDVSASTQNQAFNALVMFYREIVARCRGVIGALKAEVRAKVDQFIIEETTTETV